MYEHYLCMGTITLQFTARVIKGGNRGQWNLKKWQLVNDLLSEASRRGEQLPWVSHLPETRENITIYRCMYEHYICMDTSIKKLNKD